MELIIERSDSAVKVILISGKARHGKDTFAEKFKEYAEKNDKNVLTIRYGDILKYVCKEYFNWDGVKDEHGRTMLQYVGTEIVRNNNPDAWVNCVIELVKGFKNLYDYVLIPDTRFPNEISKWMGTGIDYISVRINRYDVDGNVYDNGLNEKQKQHLSETALDNNVFDYTIDNYDFNFPNLEIQAKELYEIIEEY